MHSSRKITLTMTDLDHILDVSTIINNKNMPPSLIFLEGLIRELDMNGYDINTVDIIELSLRM